MYLEIALLILVSILIVLVIFCIPVILQIWRITKDLINYPSDFKSKLAFNIEKYGRDYHKCKQFIDFNK